MQAHPYYPGYLEWITLSEDEQSLLWPDQVKKRGRPRVLKVAYIKRAIAYGIHAYATAPNQQIWEKFKSPWIPVCRSEVNKNLYTVKSRFFMKQFQELVPNVGTWEIAIERQENGWYYLFLRYIPPENLREVNAFPVFWMPDGVWRRTMIEHWESKQAS